MTISKPDIARRFIARHKRRPYSEQIKPANFVLVAHPTFAGRPIGVSDADAFLVMAPYTRNAEQWDRLTWTDVHTGRRFRGSTTAPPSRGSIQLQSYSDVFDAYKQHPEAKSLSAEVGPCGRETRGILARRPVTVLSVTHIGKEANDLEEVEHGTVHAFTDVLNIYDTDADAWDRLVVPVLRAMPLARVADAAGISARQAQRIRNRRSMTSPAVRQLLTRAAGEWSRLATASGALSDPAACAAYLARLRIVPIVHRREPRTSL